MKIEWNKKYTTIGMYSFLVGCGIILFYLSTSQITVFSNKLANIMGVMQPFIIGFSIAYLLNFILKFYEEKVFKLKAFENSKFKMGRGTGLLLTYLTAFFVLYLFFQFVLPQLIESIVGLVNDIPNYINTASEFVNKILGELKIEEQYYGVIMDNLNNMVDYIIKIGKDLIPILGSIFTKILSSIWNLFLGLIVSIYLLIDKEKFYALGKKITYGIFSTSKADRIIKITHISNDTFGKFLSGKILDSTIIGILTFVVLSIVSMPYTLLLSVIIGITNIIPFFGPFIGAVPSFIIVLFVSPIKAVWLLVIIFIIQQIDGNIIGPKILGDSIGISAFWILFSILVAGKFLGFIGMIIGVPLFAVIYSLIKEFIENRLKKKGLAYDTEDYM